MIGQTQKPIDEILEYLEGKEKVVLVGCGGCATVFHIGGQAEVKEMAKELPKVGKRVFGSYCTAFWRIYLLCSVE